MTRSPIDSPSTCAAARSSRSPSRTESRFPSASAFLGSRSSKIALRDGVAPLDLAEPILGPPLLPAGLDQGERRGDDPAEQGQHHERRGHDPAPVPPEEFPQAIDPRGRTGGDRLVVGEPLQVLGQADGGVVTPLPLLGQRLHHDPVEVALDEPAQAAGLGLPAGGQAGQGVGVAQAAAGRGRLDLADHPEHLVQGRPLERLAADRRRSGQQLVEDHPQGVDVGPGVHVQGVEAGLLRRHVQRRARHAGEGGVQALVGQLQAAGGLGQAEVDHPGHGPAVVGLDQDVGRLQVAVDDPLLVGVLHRRADQAEQGQPLGHGQAVLVAILGDRHPLDQVHHEERPPLAGRAGVEHPGDVGVVHDGQGLALRVEPGQDVAGVHPRLDQLERDHPLDRLDLLGQVDAAHPPLADQLAELVPARDDRAEGRPGRRRGVGGRDRRLVHQEPGRGVDEAGRPRPGRDRRGRRLVRAASGAVVPGQQRLDARAQLGVVAAFAVEERRAIGGLGEVQGGAGQGLGSGRVVGHGRDLRGGSLPG